MKKDNGVFDVVKWQGIKNDDTGSVHTGYLYLNFKADIEIISIAPNVVNAKPCKYEKGQQIGFSVKATNRKEAINVWNKEHKIIYPTKEEWSADNQLVTCKDTNIAFCGYISNEQGKANAERIVTCVNGYDALVEQVKELKEALKMANDNLHEISNYYLRDSEGYLKDDAKGWDAELDIKISQLLKN